ncbi:unnamed protein product [Paramecium pentaurelia]|uniref:Signal peptidase complex subunit 2 n=1 Tax=Paramecium pentaurelia TaxID=43138 RepID=A0A8S1U7P3_9CILI|nr:unnamed protein product [Paramecium pentaurelia]
MVKEQKQKIYRTENKFDTYMTKDAFCSFISDELISKDGLKENFKFQNFKVFFGLFMIANVIYSHYHFIPYPQDYYILIACIIFYYVSTYIYQWFEKVKEGDIFILYDDKKMNKTFGFGASQELYQRFVVLRIYSMPNKALLVECKIDSADYLDVKGYIVQPKMRSLINELLQEANKK